MNPYEKELLEETRKLAQENNKILKSLRTAHRWSTFFSFFYWIIIIGVAAGAFYFLKPYTGALLSDFNNVKSVVGKIQNLTIPSK
jgi:hypothetical protein